MLEIVFGFLAPFTGPILGIARDWVDNQHELKMLELRGQQAHAEHTWRMEEINVQADIAEMRAIRKPEKSFGVELLDKAQSLNWSMIWVLPVFYLFAFVDFMRSMVRPSVTYVIVAFYVYVRWHSIVAGAAANGVDIGTAAVLAWSDADMSVLKLTLSFWFGQRTAQWAFGGKK